MYINNQIDNAHSNAINAWNKENDIHNEYNSFPNTKEKRDIFQDLGNAIGSIFGGGNDNDDWYYDNYNGPVHDYFDVPPGVIPQEPSTPPAPVIPPTPATPPTSNNNNNNSNKNNNNNNSNSNNSKSSTVTTAKVKSKMITTVSPTIATVKAKTTTVRPQATSTPTYSNTGNSRGTTATSNTNTSSNSNTTSNNSKSNTNDESVNTTTSTIKDNNVIVQGNSNVNTNNNNNLNQDNEFNVSSAEVSSNNNSNILDEDYMGSFQADNGSPDTNRNMDGINNSNGDANSNSVVINGKISNNKSNVASINGSDDTQNSNSFLTSIVVILSILAVFIVGAVIFVHKKKLYAKEAKATREEAAFQIMNTYHNVTTGYTDLIKQDIKNQPLDNYQNPVISNITSLSNPSTNTMNYSSNSARSNTPLLNSNHIMVNPVTMPDQATLSRMENNPLNYPNPGGYYNSLNRPVF